ncbi:MAG TPA: hypothetical protein VGS17_00080 [Candidatus Limnocylindria bacterium]|nr:hypothetical protein [Candidatus Limnocylindria bacterium]
MSAAPGTADCGSAALTFCATLPPFRSPDASPGRFIDQARPCEDAAALASFCLALPAAIGTGDPAMLLARRQDACAQLASGDAPGFCLTPPASSQSAQALQREVALVLLRQRLGPEFRRTGTGAVELWTETSMSTAIADAIDATLLDDAAAVQAYFSRGFGDPPAVFLFTSRQSFANALERLFGFSADTAGFLSRQTGGITLAGIDAIAINGESVLNAGRTAIFRHELTHVAIHRLSSDAVPAWLDEGLATVVEERDPYGFDRASALSILGNDPEALTMTGSERSWLQYNTDLGGHGYGVAAEAVRVLEDRIGRAGLVAMLERIGAGRPPDAAIADALGEPLAHFLVELPGRALGVCRQGLFVSAARPDGLRIWYAYGFRPQSGIAVTVDGQGQHYAFRAVTDRYGVYAGTLGTPMLAGAYALRVTADTAERAQLGLALGDPTSIAQRGCTGP